MTMIFIVVYLIITGTVVSGLRCGIPNLNEFDSSKNICCNGVLHPKHVHGREQACCELVGGAGVVYDKEEKYCCNGTLREPASDMDEPICCGNELISNQTAEICCDSKRYPRSEYLCDNRVNWFEIPLLHSEIACYKAGNLKDYKVYNYNSNFICCGNDQVRKNSQTHMCEDEEIVRKEGPKKCGKEEYYLDEAVCCKSGEGKPDYLKPIPQHIRFHNVEPLVECVNGEIIDMYKEEVLKRNGRTTVIPKGKIVCGDSYFDSNLTNPMVHCCDGVLNYDLADSNAQCCGKVTIDPTKDTCCNNTVLPLKKLCCGDIAYDREQNDVICCNNVLANTRSHICCPVYGGELREKTDPLDDRCCITNPYNSGKKACCGQKIFEKWNTTTHECKYDQVQEKHESVTDIILEVIRNETQRKGMNNTILNNNQTPREGVNKCLVCPTNLTPGMNCTKRYEYRFFILEKDPYKQTMEVVLLSPKSLEGTQLTLRSKDMCRCIKELSSYSMFTNRDYKRKILNQEFNLSFSRRDIISKLSIEGSRMRPAVQCKLYRFHKEPHS